MSDNGRPAGFEKEQAELRESLRQIVAPLRQQLEVIEARIAENEAEHRSLVELRREATAVLRVADPEAKAKRGSSGNRSKIGQQRLDSFADWLREHRDSFPDGWVIADLIDYGHGIPITTKSGINIAFERLTEGGVTRLDSVRKRNPDGSPVFGKKPRVFKLVENG